MGLEGAGRIERALGTVLVPTFVVTGAIVTAGFFFPSVVGEVIPGRGWLTISLLFFGSGLGYLAILPMEEENERDVWDPHRLMEVRRLGIVGNFKVFLREQDKVTFGVPLLALGTFFILQGALPSQTIAVVAWIQTLVTAYFGTFFVVVIGVSLLFATVFLVWRWGDVRLGGDDAEAAYTYPVYFTMFFTAGIAAGIVFWGPAEALLHYQSPPPGFDVEPESNAAATVAMGYALFHWGFSAWGAYLLLGVPIAYYVYEYETPLRVSAILTPIVGPDGLDRPAAKFIDILAIFATIGGITTSLALLADQFLAGIDFQWGVQFGFSGAVLFVAGLSAIFILSAQSGVYRGIRRIAVVNVVLFVVFLVILIGVGPRPAILERSIAGVATYGTEFPRMSTQYSGEWVADWTVWNWVWWFSWAPFAGLFLAALSRGRRIRTVVFTAVVATGLATIVWFLVLGSTALHLETTGVSDLLGPINERGEAAAGFPMLAPLPLADLLMFLFLALIIAFMTTSADVSTLVVGILASPTDRSPTTVSVVFWGVIQAVVALLVLWTGSAELLQGLAVITGGPFALISLIAVVGMVLSVRKNDRARQTIVGRTWRWLDRWR